MNQQKTRKLPKSMRRANFVYKIIMGCLAGLNLVFASIQLIPPQYFEVCSVITSAFPVVWTFILDAAKQYEDESTPTVQSPSSVSSIDNTKINHLLNTSTLEPVPPQDTRECLPQVEQTSSSSEDISPER